MFARALCAHGRAGRLPAARNLRLVVVTGPPGAGKTPAIAAAAASLAAEGPAPAGFVQEAVWEGGAKTGFSVRDLRTGERRPIAARAAGEERECGTRFRFFAAGFRLARRALARPAGILVADELGPLELRGQGHMPALRRALRRAQGVVLVCSVRRHLIPALLAELGAAEATIVDVALESDPAQRIAAEARLGYGAQPPAPAGLKPAPGRRAPGWPGAPDRGGR